VTNFVRFTAISWFTAIIVFTTTHIFTYVFNLFVITKLLFTFTFFTLSRNTTVSSAELASRTIFTFTVDAHVWIATLIPANLFADTTAYIANIAVAFLRWTTFVTTYLIALKTTSFFLKAFIIITTLPLAAYFNAVVSAAV